MPGQVLFDQGLVTIRDPSTLAPGELAIAKQCEYQVGTTHCHKLPGRTQANSVGVGADIDGVHLLQYDTGTDKFIAVAGGSVYESTPGTTLTFGAATLTGLTDGAIPQFAAYADQWILVNGVDHNKIREPNGTWRNLGMNSPAGQTAVVTTSSVGTEVNPSSSSGTFTNLTGASDDGSDYKTTYALGTVRSTTPSVTATWNFTGGSITGYTLYVMYGASGTPGGIVTPEEYITILTASAGIVRFTIPEVPAALPTTGRLLIEYDFGAGFITLREFDVSTFFTVSSIAIPAATTLGNVKVRATLTWLGGDGDYTANIYDIRVANASETSFNVLFGIRYFVTERYIDGDGVFHESPPTLLSALVPLGTYSKITVTLPTVVANSFSDEFVIYRSIDEEAGGYPYLYEVGSVPVAQAGSTWADNLALSLTSVLDKSHLFDFITILYPDGTTQFYQVNGPPPRAKFALPYQGSMVYIPIEIPRRVYYSIPANLSSVGLEQVPEIYYLDFVTAQNDTAVSAATTNGGRALVVYFPSYAMLVTVLPQATDPQRFDTRVKEFLTTVRGAAGPYATTPFTPRDAAHTTLAAAVDSLGLWVTDGVSFIQSWTDDLDFTTAMSGVTLSAVQLFDNPFLSRLELLFSTGGAFFEYHFFYGMMKSNGQPKITGPHPVAWRSKTWAHLASTGTWLGWSGGTSVSGLVYSERQQAADASLAENSDGTVTFDVQTGDIYDQGLSRAQTVQFGFPKFAISSNKTVTFTGTFRRDGASSAQTLTKLYEAGTQKKIFINRYADRHRIRFTDATNTAMPALVAYEYTLKDSGESRDR